MSKVKPDQINFNSLMQKVRDGDIRVPDFQREFVWDRNQVISLLDSIYQHFPIGSFLFWETGDQIRSYRRVGEVELHQDDGKSVQYVLDGQQRITSLFASLTQAKITHRVNGKKVTKSLEIYFDLDEEEFVAEPFAEDKSNSKWKYASSPIIANTDDYVEFICRLLMFIDDGGKSITDVRSWIEREADTTWGKARHIQGIFLEMGLFGSNDGVLSVNEAGRKTLAGEIKPLVIGLLDAVHDYEPVLCQVAEGDDTTFASFRKVIEDSQKVPVKAIKVTRRLMWLEGLGLGELKDVEKTKHFFANSIGQEMARLVLSEREERENRKRLIEEEKRKRFFSIQQITDISSFVAVASDLSDERKQSLLRVLNNFNEYPFSIINVIDQPIEIACEIFERVNNSGQVLSVVDLMVAKTWAPTFNLREKINEFRKELANKSYNDLPDIVLLQCAAGALGGAVKRKAILNIPKGELEKNWEAVLEAVRKSIDFLQSNLRVTQAKILPYNSLIVPLVGFFFVENSHSISQKVRTHLERWFWKASVSNRYDSGAEGKMGDDIRDMLLLADGGDPAFDYLSLPITEERILQQPLNMRSAFCKTILCALNYNQPLELKDSSPVVLNSLSKFNSAELHHFFPQAYLREHDAENYALRDSMANIVLARASANKEYSHKAPSKYLKDAGNKDLNAALSSHFVEDPDEAGLWEDDFDEFTKYRAGKILNKLRDLTGQMTEIEADVENDEAKAIEKFESRFRVLITSRFESEQAWLGKLSPEFQSSLEDRVQGWLRENPNRARADVNLVDFCQILDYLKIVKAHRDLFQDVIRSRSELEAHLKTISNFRNAVMHNRDIDASTRQLALGALMWCGNVFDAAGV